MIKVTGLGELIAFFGDFKGKLGVADFVYVRSIGDILNRQSKNISYPCLWLEILSDTEEQDGTNTFYVRLTLQTIGDNIVENEIAATAKLRQQLKTLVAQVKAASPKQLTFPKQQLSYLYKDDVGADSELIVAVEFELFALPLCR